MRIGIVGQGYVGSAVNEVFSKHYETHTFDLNGKCTCKSMDELIDNSDIIFVCVPTPMKKDGSCDISIVEGVVSELDEAYIKNKYWIDKIIAIKSTIPPGTIESFEKKYKSLGIVFNPEFLTEANFIDDFKNQNRIIVGGKRPHSTKVKNLYSKVFPNVPIIKTGSKTAEMVKYMTNSFLATKVSFANEMKMLCDKLKIDYDKVVEYSIYDERLGKSHWSVPGPDGKKGFGGSCFPKDINALISICKKLDVSSGTISGAWETNLEVRPEEDWKELKGRAVVEEIDEKIDKKEEKEEKEEKNDEKWELFEKKA